MMSFGTFSDLPPAALAEAYGNTVYYTWRAVDRPTTLRLQHFVQDLVAQRLLPVPKSYPTDIHMSIIRAENDLMNYVPDRQSIRVKPIRWALLGGAPHYYLAIITELHQRVQSQLDHAKKQKAQFVFESFLPHISVAQYDTKQIDIHSLPIPAFSIVLDGEDRHQFDHSM